MIGPLMDLIAREATRCQTTGCQTTHCELERFPLPRTYPLDCRYGARR
jgi:hypothetical protein